MVDLLRALRHLGLELTINDEGGYWPGCSMAALRRNLDEMNGLVAAAGAWKDRGTGVVSPIFQHPQFERLEAEGQSQAAPLLEKLCQANGEREVRFFSESSTRS